MTNLNAVNTNKRLRYLERGICPTCKCRKLKENYSKCEVCYEATNKWMADNRARKNEYNKSRYDELKRQGLCVTCKRPTGGNVYCRLCTTNMVRTRAFKRPRESRNRWSKR